MKKFFIVLLVAIILLAGLAYGMLFTKETTYHQAIAASADSILELRNFDRTQVRVQAADTNKITVDLKGAGQDLISLLQTEEGVSKVDFPDTASGISGTITVPKGMLVKVSLSSTDTLNIDDGGARRSIGDKKSFLIDTSNLNSFAMGQGNNVTFNGWGDLIVWDDQKWDLMANTPGEQGASAKPQENPLAYCGVGSQAIRNYCCVLQQQNTATPACNGVGHWAFDNVTRDCRYKCETEGQSQNQQQNPAGNSDCSAGVQTAKDNCCALKYAGQYQGCVGSWDFDNAIQKCKYVCSDGGSSGGGAGGNGGSGDGNTGSEGQAHYSDSTSNFCATVLKPSDKDACCNDALKNNLSSGPHPGYPDCIGTWIFDVEKGCQFKCAEYTEMMRILEELREKAKNQQNP